jgi:hypothetical protein
MRVLVLAALLSLALGVASASAARYAAPGGTGADPCADQLDPCSIYAAADGGAPGTTVTAGDVVMLAPGTYTDIGGDLGPTQRVQPAPNVRVQGEPGKARPMIRLESNEGSGAFFLGGGATLSDVAIDNVASGVFPHNNPALTIDSAGVAERIVAHSTLAPAITCTMLGGGILRESVCRNDASNGTALGASLSTSAGTRTVTVRDVTAIATGSSSFGASFNYFGSEASPTVFNVSAKGVIARGQGVDVRAAGLRLGSTGVGATTNIILDHSDYATTDTLVSGGGSASVTPAGSGTNITAAPLLAADGYHQLPGSPTLDKGAVDGSSGTVDVDGQLRSIGSAPDIGADELAHATTLNVSCSPGLIVAPSESTTQCPVVVTDQGSASGPPPTGLVRFSANLGKVADSCVLAPVSTVASSCTVSWAPVTGLLGDRTLVARYDGDSGHEGSEGSAAVRVTVIPRPDLEPRADSGNAGPQIQPSPPAVAPATKLGRQPPSRTPNQLARFTFSSDQAGASFECKLGSKGRFRPCVSPFKRTVAIGPHVLRVRAVTAAGLRDGTSVVFHWTRTGAV